MSYSKLQRVREHLDTGSRAQSVTYFVKRFHSRGGTKVNFTNTASDEKCRAST